MKYLAVILLAFFTFGCKSTKEVQKSEYHPVEAPTPVKWDAPIRGIQGLQKLENPADSIVNLSE